MRIEAINRGPEPAPLHLIPQIWFRNTWCWGKERKPEPTIVGERSTTAASGSWPMILISNWSTTCRCITASASACCTLRPAANRCLPTTRRIWLASLVRRWANQRPFVKDAFHRQIIGGESCTNPAGRGTKGAIHYTFDAVPPGGSVVLRLRLSDKIVADDKLLSRSR